MAAMREMMQRLKLTVNEERPTSAACPTDSFDFLGTPLAMLLAQDGAGLSSARVLRRRGSLRSAATISELTSRRWLLWRPDDRVGRLNRTLVGWANYFRLGPVSNAYGRWIGTRGTAPQVVVLEAQDARIGAPHVPGYDTCTNSLGLEQLALRRATFRGRTHDALSESRMREIRTSGSTSGDWKRSSGLD